MKNKADKTKEIVLLKIMNSPAIEFQECLIKLSLTKYINIKIIKLNHIIFKNLNGVLIES